MIKNITIIGAGRLAWHIAPALYQKGFIIKQVISRTLESAVKLSSKVGAIAMTNIDKIGEETDLILMALPDNQIEIIATELAKNKNFKGAVVHTSGTKSIDLIEKYFKNTGVLYPLQTFSFFSKPDISKIPFCLEASNSEFLKQLEEIALQLSPNIHVFTSSERLYIHLSAVIANNFTNFLYSAAYKILNDNKINTSILLPLIEETAARLHNNNPIDVQTGPAIRGDMKTIDKHLEILEKYPDLKDVYTIITNKILKQNLINI